MLLEAREVSFGYGKELVLRGISLSLAEGEVVALIGPNGSGKSTLIKVLAGLLGPAGSVLWDGKSGWTRRELARKVAYLPQFPSFEEGQVVGDVLRLGRVPYLGAFGLEGREDVRIVEEVAEKLGLRDWMGRRMEELSGGERQRVFLGRCLVQRPGGMLLDEPNSSLDLKHQVEMLRVLRGLAAEGVGVLLASHELNLAGMFADRMILLDKGSVVAEGRPDVVMREEVLSRVYGVRMVRMEKDGVVGVVAGGEEGLGSRV